MLFEGIGAFGHADAVLGPRMPSVMPTLPASSKSSACSSACNGRRAHVLDCEHCIRVPVREITRIYSFTLRASRPGYESSTLAAAAGEPRSLRVIEPATEVTLDVRGCALRLEGAALIASLSLERAEALLLLGGCWRIPRAAAVPSSILRMIRPFRALANVIADFHDVGSQRRQLARRRASRLEVVAEPDPWAPGLRPLLPPRPG
eukprot:tig00020911_g15756.t1